MRVETLISTMNLKNNDENMELIKQMKVKTNSITINQITNNDINIFRNDVGENKVFSYSEKGISKSRNKAIYHSKGDILIIADNDMIYEENYVDTVINAYERYKEADIIAFSVNSLNKDRPIHNLSSGIINESNFLKISSVQMTLKRSSIIDNNLSFNELFGAGAAYNCGEENIFLKDAIKKGLNIIYVDKKIADVKNETSTWWTNTFDEKYFVIKGACYFEIAGNDYMRLINDFAERKYDIYKNDYTKEQVIQFMVNGKEEYEKIKVRS